MDTRSSGVVAAGGIGHRIQLIHWGKALRTPPAQRKGTGSDALRKLSAGSIDMESEEDY